MFISVWCRKITLQNSTAIHRKLDGRKLPQFENGYLQTNKQKTNTNIKLNG